MAETPPTRATSAHRLRALAPALLIALPLLWLVAVPLIITITSAFKPTGFLLDPGYSLENFSNTYGDPHLWRLIGRTLVFAGGATLLAIALGAIMAFIVERSDLGHAGIIRLLLVLPMAMPPFLLAMAYVILLSPRTGLVNQALIPFFGLTEPPLDIYTLTGMILVEGLALAPSAFLVLAPAFRNIDASLEEAALMAGASGGATIRRIVLPLLTPATAGTAAYLFIVSCMVFDVPGTIGLPAGVELLSTHMYDLINNSPTGLPDYGGLSALAMMIVAALTILCFIYQRLLAHAERYVTITGKNFRPRPFCLGKMRWAAWTFVIVYALVAILAPLATLVWMSLLPYQTGVAREAFALLTLANHKGFLVDPLAGKAFTNSLAIALVASIAVGAISLIASWIVVRTRSPGRQLIDLLSFLPMALPGVLIGTALIYVYLTVPILPVYGTFWIIAIAHTTMYLSFASRATNASLAQLHPEMEEAARMSGANWLATMRRVVTPLTFPALAAVWIWVFSHSLRELSAALMLQGRDNKTVPTLLFDYWSRGQPTKTAAVGVWLIVGLAALMALGALLQKVAASRRMK